MNRNNNNNNNGYREEKPFCYFHPRQVVVGVCPLCLNERLLIVAAKQGRHQHHRTNSSSKASSQNNRLQSSIHRKATTSSSINKIFAFGSLFTRHHEPQQWKSEINFEFDASPSPEESFISIKFEENGVASWEKGSTVSNKVSLENCNWNHHHHHHATTLQIQNKDTNKSVIEHGKSRDTLRWRKRIGHMFHLIRWRRSGGVCHVSSKVEGVKVRKGGWMRTLTKRKKKTVE